MIQKQIRKLQDHLTVSGGGVIIFGLWSLIKGLVYLIRSNGNPNTLPDVSGSGGLLEHIIVIIIIVVIIVFLLIDMGMRLIVGLNARAEGHGRKKGMAYIVLAIILAVFSVFFFALYAYYIFKGGSDEGIIDIVVTVIVDLTSLTAILDVIISAFRLRKINRLTSESEDIA